jgi:hypothetical protein
MVERFILDRGVLPVMHNLEILSLNSHPTTLNFLSGFIHPRQAYSPVSRALPAQKRGWQEPGPRWLR